MPSKQIAAKIKLDKLGGIHDGARNQPIELISPKIKALKIWKAMAYV